MVILRLSAQAFIHKRPVVLVVCLLMLSSLFSGCGKNIWMGVPPEEIPTLAKEEFSINKGMTRSQVEAFLGFPAEIGQTKEGHVIAQYTFGARVRSVEYDLNDAVIAAYPN